MSRMFSCTFCPYSNQHPCNVKTHMTRHHKVKNPKIHKCPFCHRMYGNLFEMKAHMGRDFCSNTNKQFARKLHAKMSQRRYLYCPHCEYRSWVPTNLSRHMTDKHNVPHPKIYNCANCPASFPNAKCKKAHKCKSKLKGKVEKEEKKIDNEDKKRKQVPMRTLFASSPTPVKKEPVEVEEKGKVRMVSCLHCSYKSKYPSHIRSHMRNIHRVATPKINKCDLCGEMFENAYILKSHVESSCRQLFAEMESPAPPPAPKKIKLEDKSSVFRCHICEEFFQFGTELRAHLIKCQKMNNQQQQSPAKRKQIKKIEEIPKITVSKTTKNQSTIAKAAAKSNQSVVAVSKPTKSKEVRFSGCLKCSYKSKYPSHIRSHMKKVHGVANPKINKCENCGHFFQNAYVLKSHSLSCPQKNKKKKKKIAQEYKCPSCPAVLHTFLDLRIHKKERHGKKASSVETFSCLLCSYSSMYTCSVRAHMKMTHKVSNPKIHKCKFCSDMFQNLYQLKGHVGENCCVNTNPDFARKLLEAEKKRWWYNCSRCSYRAGYPQCIRSHLQVKHKISHVSFLKCTPCRQIFLEQQQLNKHNCNRNSNNNNKIINNKNIKKNVNKRVVNKKVKRVIKKEKCFLCDEMFLTQMELDTHMLQRHTKIPPKPEDEEQVEEEIEDEFIADHDHFDKQFFFNEQSLVDNQFTHSKVEEEMPESEDVTATEEEGVDSSLQLVSSEAESLDFSSFPPDTVFYTYDDEEGQGVAEDGVYYTVAYFDPNILEGGVEDSGNALVVENEVVVEEEEEKLGNTLLTNKEDQ